MSITRRVPAVRCRLVPAAVRRQLRGDQSNALIRGSSGVFSSDDGNSKIFCPEKLDGHRIFVVGARKLDESPAPGGIGQRSDCQPTLLAAIIAQDASR